MTNPHSADDLLSLATPYALHAVTDSEAADIDRQLSDAPLEVAEAFAAEVRAVRETMAVISAATAVEPPSHLRAEILQQISDDNVRTLPTQPRQRRWTRAVLAGAAAVAIGIGALVVGYTLRPPATPTTAEEIFAAPDVRTVSGDIPGGGTATVVFSREENAGVLVMNNVTPPQTGTVYQMWLIDSEGPHSAGTMDSGQVAPSTTAVLPDLGTSQTLAFTVEPPGGSAQPTTPVFAQLPLV
ncbi:anti-sigma factor [Mycolicibacterium sp. BiH015]|uniref:anti-sigma factor n=1 Tax=Mycolicibacterium sp. BiH015 TaxID=3018808 RepID=UPI0022E8FE62|nr:anti-sigma factor [Mycolicibacterium sp. BiH015]MDA2889298.1 anti-sigma factor [Mycolicibacterium sp. BiH015]